MKYSLLVLLLSFSLSAKNIPHVELPTLLNNKTFKLDDHLGKRTIVINFFASWCTSCIAEIGELHALQKKYHSNDYLFLAINAGERKKIIKKFVKRYKFNYLILLDQDRSISKAFNVKSLPKTIVINKNKQIIFQGNRPPQKL